MKIALYLGSFNPFHNGHLKVVQQAFVDFKMDSVVIVPTMQNPFKKDPPLDIDKRKMIIKESLMYFIHCEPFYMEYPWYKMILIPPIVVDNIEKSLIPPYYSYATLHALKNKYCNDEIFILCGEDTIEDIPNWMNGGEILKDYDFLICDRTEESSTEIRNRIKNGESIKGLVSDNIINIIEKLYSKYEKVKTQKNNLS